MNMLAALTLSPKHQAYSKINTMIAMLVAKPAYILKVTEIQPEKGDEKEYRFEIFQVTYPDKTEGKGWGAPKIAEKPHFSQTFILEDLISFFDLREFSADDNWYIVEGDINLAA